MESADRVVDENALTKKVIIGASIAAGLGIGGYFVYRYVNNSPSSNKRKPAKDQRSASHNAGGTAARALLDLKSRRTSLKAEGNRLFKQEDYAGAIEQYSEAINLSVENAAETGSQPPDEIGHILYQNRAACFEKLQQHDLVVRDCTAALQLDKHYIKAIQRRAKAYEKLGKLEEALVDLTAVCFLSRFQNSAAIGEAEGVLGALGKKRATEAFQKRIGDDATSPVPLSRTFVDAYLASFCDDPVLNSLKASREPKSGGDGEIIGDQKAEQEGNEVVMNGYHQEEEVEVEGFPLAQQCLMEQRYEEVTAACSREIDVLKREAHVPEALLLRATFGLMRGQCGAARADLDRLLEQELACMNEYSERYRKLKANALLKAASLSLQQGQKEQSLKEFEAAEEADANSPDVYLHRGQVKVLLGDIAGAQADYDRAVALRPDFGIAHVQKAYADYRAAIASGSQLASRKALQALEKTAEAFPDCGEGWGLLGQAYAEAEDAPSALRMFEKALELNPGNANVCVHRGLLSLQTTGDPERAVKEIKGALEIDRNCEFAYETLGTIELQRGNLKAALGYLEQALRLARTELELAHLYAVYEGARAQKKVGEVYGIAPAGPGLGGIV